MDMKGDQPPWNQIGPNIKKSLFSGIKLKKLCMKAT